MTIELKIALAVAIIAAISSMIATAIQVYATLSNAKKPADMQLAKFRKEWIETLRKNISHFLALKFKEHSMVKFRDHALKRGNIKIANKYSEEIPNVSAECGRLRFEIGLMLNTNETDHQELDKELGRILQFKDGKMFGDSFMNLSRRVLKREWDILKLDMQGKINE